MTPCIDLRQIAGKRYRIGRDEAYAAEYGARGFTDDPWLITIPAQFGHFYPHSDKLIGFATNNRGHVARAR